MSLFTDLEEERENKGQYESPLASFGIQVPDTDYKTINRHIARTVEMGADPVQEQNRWAQAEYFSRRYGFSVETALNNLDALTEYQLGKKAEFTMTNTRAIQNSFELGDATLRSMQLAGEFQKADMAGDVERANALAKQIQEIDAWVEQNQDNVSRSVIVELLKSSAEQLPNNFNALQSGMLGSAIVGGGVAGLASIFGVSTVATGGAIIPISAVIGAASLAGMTMGNYKAVTDLESGRIYYDLRQRGIDPTQAGVIAELAGALYGVTEVGLGLIPAATQAATGSASSLSSKAISRFMASGKLSGLTQGLLRYTGGVVEQGAQEGLQSFIDDGVAIVGDVLAEDGQTMTPTLEESLKKAWQSAVEGAKASILLGLPSGVINTIGSVDTANRLVADARKSPEVDTFVETHMDALDENMSREAKQAVLTQVWEREQSNARQNRSQSEGSGVRANQAALRHEGTVSGNTAVVENRDVVAEVVEEYRQNPDVQSITRNEDETVTITFTSGESFNVTEQTIAEQLGMETTNPTETLFNPQVRFQSARQTSDAYLDSQENQYVESRLRETLEGRVTDETIRAGVGALRVASRATNIPIDELLSRVSVLYNYGNIDAGASGILGSQRDMENGTKLIQLSFMLDQDPNAGPFVVTHEIGHMIRSLASPEQLREITAVYGGTEGATWIEDIKVRNGKYVVGTQTFDTLQDAYRIAVEPNEERFADDFARFLRTEEAPNAQMEGVFSDMANLLFNTEHRRGQGTLTPAVASAFRNLINSFSDTQGSTMFSDVMRTQLLQQRKSDVRNAVSLGFPVRSSILEEFANEDWAREEINLRAYAESDRAYLTKFKDADGEDIYVDDMTFDDWFARLTEEANKDGSGIQEGEESKYRKIYNYYRSKPQNSVERDRQFVNEYSASDAKLVELSQKYRNFEGQVERIGQGGTSLGVSQEFLRLTSQSTAQEFADARKELVNNMSVYRKANDRVDFVQEQLEHLYGNQDAPIERMLFAEDDTITEVTEETDTEESVDSDGIDMSLTQEDYESAAGEEISETENETETEAEDVDYDTQIQDLQTTSDAEQAEIEAFESSEAQLQQEREELRNLEEEKRTLDSQIAETEELIRGSAGELRERYENTLREYRAAVALANRELRSAASRVRQLEQNLNNRRARVTELRTSLTERNEQIRRLTAQRDTARRRLFRNKVRAYVNKRTQQIRHRLRWKETTRDISFRDRFIALQSWANGGEFHMVDGLEQYLTPGIIHNMEHDVPYSRWQLQEIEHLWQGVKLLAKDASATLQEKKARQSEWRRNFLYSYYDEVYGEGRLTDEGFRSKYALLEGMFEDEKAFREDSFNQDLTGFDRLWDRALKLLQPIKYQIIKPQRLMRQLDGNKEGPMYDFFVRAAWHLSNQQTQNENRRYAAFKGKIDELGLDISRMHKQKAVEYTTTAGETIELTRADALGVYVYMQNEQGLLKLLNEAGNGIGDLDQLNRIVSSLTDNEKALGDWMIDEIGGDEVFSRMEKVLADYYNKPLGRESRYFPFVSDKIVAGGTDMLIDTNGQLPSFVERGMTEARVQGAKYPLHLDVITSYINQVARQEHFISFAGWTKEASNLMTRRGGLADIIEHKYGKQAVSAVRSLVDDVANPPHMTEQFDKKYSKLISNAALGALAGNFMTILKQTPAAFAAVRGDISMTAFIQAEQMFTQDRKGTKDFIYRMSGDMANRVIDQELERARNSDLLEENPATRVSNFLMKGASATDRAIADRLWLSSYLTNLQNGFDEQESAFRATQLIMETQNTSGNLNLSKLQRNSNPFVRLAIMFTNQTLNISNQIFFDLPFYLKNRNFRKFGGTLANVGLSAMGIVLLSGALWSSDDPEEVKENVRKEAIKELATYLIPIAGGTIADGVDGWGGGDLVGLWGTLGNLLGAAASRDENGDVEWVRIGKHAWNLLEDVGSVTGLPTTLIHRTVNSVSEQNPLWLFGSDWAEIYKRMMED